MIPSIERLLILQDRDQKIRMLRLELKNLPAGRAAAEAKLAAEGGQLEAAKQRARDIEVEKKKLQLDAQAKRDSIAKFRTQQFQTRKNEEFQALTNEIKRFEAEIVALEDRELELMEETEKARQSIAQAEGEHAQLKSLTQRQLADIDAKLQAIDAKLAELETERAKLAEGLEEELLEEYNRLFYNKGGLAVVALEHGNCMGCHMKLTTQTAVRVKSGRDIVHCEQCGRILYYSE